MKRPGSKLVTQRLVSLCTVLLLAAQATAGAPRFRPRPSQIFSKIPRPGSPGARTTRAVRRATLGDDVPRARVLQRAARRKLGDGERIVGTESAWYRMSDGRIERARPNESQADLSKIAAARDKGIDGVAGATFVTNTGRRIRTGDIPTGARLRAGALQAGLLAPAVIAANMIADKLGTAYRGAEPIIQKVASPILPEPPPEPSTPTPRAPGVSVVIEGEGDEPASSGQNDGSPEDPASVQGEPSFRHVEVRIETAGKVQTRQNAGE